MTQIPWGKVSRQPNVADETTCALPLTPLVLCVLQQSSRQKHERPCLPHSMLSAWDSA